LAIREGEPHEAKPREWRNGIWKGATYSSEASDDAWNWVVIEQGIPGIVPTFQRALLFGKR